MMGERELGPTLLKWEHVQQSLSTSREEATQGNSLMIEGNGERNEEGGYGPLRRCKIRGYRYSK
jgi:hypothetical protein